MSNALRFSMPLKIQDRDIKIFQEIAECRFLSLNQIAALCFEGNREAARKRLGKLTRAGAVNCQRVTTHGQIFTLNRRTATVIKEFDMSEGRQAPVKISLATLEHELAVRDFRTTVLRGAPQEGFEIKEFSIDSRNLSFEMDGVATRPDGFFQANVAGRTERFFFEIDAGTESLEVLSNRLRNYYSYYRSGRFAGRLGEGSERFRSFPFRVLFLFKTDRRRASARAYFKRARFTDFTVSAIWNEGVLSVCRVGAT